MGERLHILLVEDDPDHVFLVRKAMERAEIPHDCDVASDGVEAMDRLRGDEARLPDLIVMDLSLPRQSGRETLEMLKADPKLRRIPVVVMTSSDDPSDVLNAYRAGAATFIRKEAEIDRMYHTMATLLHYWSEVATTPLAH